jgi:hypothetical protein
MGRENGTRDLRLPRVAERWAIRDDLGFLRQLGVSLR